MFTCSPQEKIIVAFIKMTPFKSFHPLVFLTLLFSEWSSAVFISLVNPSQHWLYGFEIHISTPRTTEGLIWNDHRRLKHSAMLQKEKPCIKSLLNRICLILPKYNIFSSFSTALQKLQKTFKCFPEDKINYIYSDFQIQKVFTPRLLMHGKLLNGHFYKCHYYFLLWTTCKHLLCEISYSGQY